MAALSATPDCCWNASAPPSDFQRLSGISECEVLVLEAREVGRQVTGRSTAKVTTQHGLIYRYLIDTFGQELAWRYADANREGVEQIRQWVTNLGIDCACQPQSAYAYACSADGRAAIEREAEAARSLASPRRCWSARPCPSKPRVRWNFPTRRSSTRPAT